MFYFFRKCLRNRCNFVLLRDGILTRDSIILIAHSIPDSYGVTLVLGADNPTFCIAIEKKLANSFFYYIMCQLCQNSFAPIRFIQIVEEYEILRFLFVSKEVTILCCQSLKIIIIINVSGS